MVLEAPRDGTYLFELDSVWSGALDVDGSRIFGWPPFAPGASRMGDVYLERGRHQVELIAQPNGQADASLRLLWKPPGESLRHVDPADLYDPDRPRLHRLGAVVAFPMALCGSLVLGLVVLSWVASRPSRGSSREVLVAVVLVAALALLFRGINATTYPRFRGDEIHNAWAGFNLLHEGTPRTWSWLPAYEKKTPIMWLSYNYPVVEASFDHPPLLPLLLGIEATLLNAGSMFDCTPPRIRPLMVLLGAVSCILLFLVARALTTFRIAFLAAVVLAASPLAAFNGRLAKEDCLVQAFFLGALLLFVKYRTQSRVGIDVATGVLSGLAALTKVMGLAVGFGLALVAIAQNARNWKRPLWILGVSVAVASLYPLYGMLMDPDTYVAVTHYLSLVYSRESLVDKLFILPRLIVEPKVAADVPTLDGWILLGWLSFYRFFRDPVLTVPFVSYLLMLVTTVLSSALWGFYIVPVLPFLALSAAREVDHALSRQSFFSVFLFVGLFFLPAVGYLGYLPIPGGARGLLFVSCLPLLPALFRIPRGHTIARVSRSTLAVMLVIAVLANAWRLIETW